jgi:uncharacterized protein YbjT (DUF2867 family)
MKALVTGANGYIGLRLITSLLDAGYEVLAMVRNKNRFPLSAYQDWGDKIQVIEGDFLKPDSLPEQSIIQDVKVAYYLLHSMGTGKKFAAKESACAHNFIQWIDPVAPSQIVYLGGIAPEDAVLSEHLESRSEVARILGSMKTPLTTLRASIIVGSGSASFEIIRDLVEKLPVMSTPRWTRTKCQPIAIRNVIGYLIGVIKSEVQNQTLGENFDIGSEAIMTYQEMLEGYAAVRGLKRWILPVPFLSPKLSAYWLYFMTATSFPLARALVGSLHLETTCGDTRIRSIVPQELLSYEESISLALSKIAQNRIPSAWYDSMASGRLDLRHIQNVQVPEHGVLEDSREMVLAAPRDEVIDAVWRLGGKAGWPSMDWAWHLRGTMDKMVGGAGMRRGRRDIHDLRPGDALDFWRVVMADRKCGRLILYAEMKLPGEAWLEFNISEDKIRQRAVFRPKGLLGRLYWASTYPFHLIIFPRMLKVLTMGWRAKALT